jgi:hypothetical protein
MSLAEYQDAWNRLLFDEKLRDDWREGKAEFKGLTDTELKAINNLPEDRINLIAPSTVRGRSHVFFHSIPPNITCLLDETVRHNLAYTFSVKYPEIGMHPRAKGMVEWLKFIKYTLTQNHLSAPHIEDILNYEIKLNELVYYRIPVPVPSTPGPILSEWAALFSAGPFFKDVLENLDKGLQVNEIAGNPKHGYLLTRGPNGIGIEKLHWTIFEILSSCDGMTKWNDIVIKLLEEESSLVSQSESLNGWEKYYLKEGIICRGNS